MGEIMTFDKDAYVREGREQHAWSIVALERENDVDWSYASKRAEESVIRAEASLMLAKEWQKLCAQKHHQDNDDIGE